MWFHLDLDGIDFHFQISQYRQSNREIWEEHWCQVDLTLQSGNWLNYEISSSILLSCEVEELRDKLSQLLSNKIQSPEKLEFIEPDLSFVLHPQEDLTLNANYISLRFDREDIECLRAYLDLVTKQIDFSNPSIKKLIDSDIIRTY